MVSFGHWRLKLDLEAWRRHHSRPLGSSRFSSSFLPKGSKEV